MSHINDFDDPPQEYLTVPDFPESLAVSDRLVRKWIKADLLPAYQFHGHYRIQKADAIAFIERARFQA